MDKLRVIMLENRPSTQEGGQEISFYDLAKGLAERGHAIELLYVREGDLLPEYRKFCRRVLKVGGYQIDRKRPLGSLLRMALDLLRVPSAPRTVVYADQYIDSLFAALLARRTAAPFVCHLRLPPPEPWCGQFRFGMRRAARAIAVSERTRSQYRETGIPAAPIDVVPNGIEPARFRSAKDPAQLRQQWSIRSDAYVVSYAGRLHPAKGVNVLIEAFAQVRRTHDEAVLVIAGSQEKLHDAEGRPYDYIGELKAFSQKLGVAQSVRWIGHCDDMPAFYRASDVTVLPSLWSEPFGRTLIESMAAGVPAVASNVGGIPEILTGEFQEHLFPSGSSDALARKLLALRQWRRSDADLARRCREHVEKKFTLARTLDGVENVLLDVAGSRSAAVRKLIERVTVTVGRQLARAAADPSQRRRTAFVSALEWLIRAHAACGRRGLPVGYAVGKGWLGSYPEVSGYIVSTLRMVEASGIPTPELSGRLRRTAQATLNWLLKDMYRESEGYPDWRAYRPYGPGLVFDTGQILHGLISGAQWLPDDSDLERTARIARWLATQLSEDGAWRRGTFWSGEAPAYYLRVSWALLRASRLLNDPSLARQAAASIEYFKKSVLKDRWSDHAQRQENLSFTDILHFRAYTVQGMLECGAALSDQALLNTADRRIEELASHFEARGVLPGAIASDGAMDRSFRCPTGEFQTAVCAHRAAAILGKPHYAAAADAVFDRALVGCYKGGVFGSLPLSGRYHPWTQISWGAKFLIDAALAAEAGTGGAGALIAQGELA